MSTDYAKQIEPLWQALGPFGGALWLQLALITLLAVAAAQDLRRKEVSNWLTLLPLLAAVAWRTAAGEWALLLALALTALFSERALCQGRNPSLAAVAFGFLATFFLLPASPSYWTLLGWLAAWLMWELHLIGGADAKLMMVLVTVYPDPRMLFLIVWAKGIAGLVVSAVLHGRRAVRRFVSAAWRVLVARQPPDRETLEQEGLPAVFVYTMAGLAYPLVCAGQYPGQSIIPPGEMMLGDPTSWGILALAFALGTVPVALYLRDAKTPRTAGPSPRQSAIYLFQTEEE